MRTVDDPPLQELLAGDGIAPATPILELEGQWVVLAYSRDATRVLLQRFWSETRSTLQVANTKSGALTPIGDEAEGVVYELASFTSDPDMLVVTTNRESDFVQLHTYRVSTKEWKNLSSPVPWDVEEIAVAPNGKTIVFSANEDGQSVLYSAGVAGGRPTRLKLGITGVATELRFFGPMRLAFTLARPNEPGDVFTYELDTGRLVRWTESEAGGLDPSRFVSPTLTRITSFDGVSVPAFVFRPEGSSRFPVLLWMHGGPEEQFRPSFDPVIQYFVSRGIAVIAPNVRGSDGYGRTYLGLDDGVRRKDAVRDVGALLDRIGAQKELDPLRVGIHGASYGGFMVLASLVEYGERISAGSNQVGVASIVTFLENTRADRRDLRRAEYGDERDPEVRSALLDASPLTHAARIQSALLVAHGMRDPRVPVSEAESIVHAVRSGGHEVWYLLAPSEGHAFRQRQNRDAFYRTMATFFERHLLGPAGTRPEDAPQSADAGTFPPATDSGAR
jgi:dipeptidyl aminopeptidase/acylaminoacyl peptidase